MAQADETLVKLNEVQIWSLDTLKLGGDGTLFASDGFDLCILVYMVIYHSGKVSLELLLPSWYPSCPCGCDV